MKKKAPEIWQYFPFFDENLTLCVIRETYGEEAGVGHPETPANPELDAGISEHLDVWIKIQFQMTSL